MAYHMSNVNKYLGLVADIVCRGKVGGPIRNFLKYLLTHFNTFILNIINIYKKGSVFAIRAQYRSSKGDSFNVASMQRQSQKLCPKRSTTINQFWSDVGQKIFLEKKLSQNLKVDFFSSSIYMGSFVSLGWDFDHTQNLASSYKGF